MKSRSYSSARDPGDDSVLLQEAISSSRTLDGTGRRAGLPQGWDKLEDGTRWFVLPAKSKTVKPQVV